MRVAKEPYLRSFQYKVLNSILYTNNILYKIVFVSDPNCCFCKRSKETANHLFFCCSFSHSFWSEVTDKILRKLCSCECLLLRDVMIGTLKEEMDLVNYVIILGKNYLWTCRQKVIKPSFSLFKIILETEKHISCKLNKPREDKGVRELLPHIGPLPILIPLKLFLVTNRGEFKFEITNLVLKQLP